MTRTLRTSITIASIALALSACSTGSTDADVAADAAPVAPAAAPAPAPEAPAEEAPASDATGSDKSQAPAAETDAPAADSPAPLPISAPAESTQCSAAQSADGGTYMVANIPANDADGGLVVRAASGTSFEARTVLPEFTQVSTSVHSDEYWTCIVEPNGSIWWEISHASLATGGWVNASYLAPFSDEPDAHGDCVVYYGEEGCVVAFYAAGELVHVEDYPAEGGAELHYECVYNADDAACDILAFVGPGDGVGNWLGQTPTEFLVTDCANLTGAFQKLACAELALR